MIKEYMHDVSNKKEALDDCFAEKAKSWIWVSGFFIILILAATSFSFFLHTSQNTEVQNMQYGPIKQARWIALQRSYYGYTRYRVPGVGPAYRKYYPSYNPRIIRGGIPAVTQASPVGLQPYGMEKPVLIKELAMEVVTVRGFPGALVYAVYGKGWAQKAGLKKGDIIVKFNGKRIKSARKFQTSAALTRPELNVRIVFIRNGKKINSIIKIGEGEMEGVTMPAVF